MRITRVLRSEYHFVRECHENVHHIYISISNYLYYSLSTGSTGFPTSVSYTEELRGEPIILNHSTKSDMVLLNPEKDPASRPKGMIYWYKEQCIKVVKAWLFALGENREMPEREAIRIASNILQYPSPRRLNRVMETLENQGVIEFADDFKADSYHWSRQMRILSIPFEIAQEINR